MPQPPYRALRTALVIFSLLTAAGGLLMIFGGKPLKARLFLCPPESELSILLTPSDADYLCPHGLKARGKS